MKVHFPLLSVLLILSLFVFIAVFVIGNYAGKSKADRSNIDQNSNPSSRPNYKTTPTRYPGLVSTPAPALFPENGQRAGIEKYKYPQSVVLSETEYRLEMESTVDINQITPWYKDRLADHSTKSFVTTNTNGEILTKLSGTSPSKEQVEVEIKKAVRQQKVSITISLELP